VERRAAAPRTKSWADLCIQEQGMVAVVVVVVVVVVI
jgi:hypothetical protein